MERPPSCPCIPPFDQYCDCDSVDSDFDLDDNASISSKSSVSSECSCHPNDPPSSIDYSDILVIGAGMCSIALLARLQEDSPASLYTDLEHSRLRWLRKSKNSRPKRVKGERKLQKIEEIIQEKGRKITVIDPAGKYMNKWDTYFKNLEIQNLRSPLFFHGSPGDNDALLAYCGKYPNDEMESIASVVGREKSKNAKKSHPKSFGRDAAVNERNRQDYFRPLTNRFETFCQEEIIERYELPQVQQGFVQSIKKNGEKGFLVESLKKDGTIEIFGTKAVIISIGPSSKMNIPPIFEKFCGEGLVEGKGWCHSAAFGQEFYQFPCRKVKEIIIKGQVTTMVIVGGGMTSAQIVDLAISRGVTKVILLTRGHVKIRHFDFGLEWVTKFSNLKKMEFHQESNMKERLEMIKNARDGGSITPAYQKKLKQHVKQSRLEIKTFTNVKSAKFDDESGWSLDLEITCHKTQSKTFESIKADFLVLSTGSKLDFENIPFLQELHKSSPIEMVNSIPVLSSSLQWNDLPIFVLGAYAMLELGPDASNLSGTRAGAERVFTALTEAIGNSELLGDSPVKEKSRIEESYYSSLQEEIC